MGHSVETLVGAGQNFLFGPNFAFSHHVKRVRVFLIEIGVLLLAQGIVAQPTVSNVRSAQKVGTTQVIVTYDLAQPQGLVCTVTLEVSKDGGTTYSTALGATGAVGAGIVPGLGKTVVWDAGLQWQAQLQANAHVRVTADDNNGPSGVGRIPGSTFLMGNSVDLEYDTGKPAHVVSLSAFVIGQTEVTWAEWREVRDWATSHGYADLDGTGRGKADNHPVHSVSWYDVVKWLNAKSEKSGLTPVYFTNDAQTSVYRAGAIDLTNTQVKWSANGYRLPTEAEWEFAARGGMAGKRFPWGGDTISHSQANYNSGGGYFDVSPTRGFHPNYNDGIYPYTSPVRSFAPNGFGLYDLDGNVGEWCWDRYEQTYPSSAQTDPRGPSSGTERMARGGHWINNSFSCNSFRRASNSPSYTHQTMGFRWARGATP